MINKLKLFITLCLAVAMACSVTACKKTDSIESSSSVSTSETTEETSSEPEELIEEESEEPIDEEWEDLPASEDEDIYYEELSVYNNEAPINENFQGINGVHMGWGFMPDAVGNRTPLKDWQLKKEYDRIAYDMGVKQIRTLYQSAFVWDSAKGQYVWDVKENKALAGFYDSLKAWQDRGVEVGMSATWSLASFVGLSPDSGNDITTFAGQGWYVKDDLNTSLKNYRAFMKDSILNLEANGIHNVKYLFAFTECNNTYHSANAALYPDKTTMEHRDYDTVCTLFDQAVTALHDGLTDAGKRDAYKIVGPCDNYRLDFEYTDSEQYSIMVKYTLEHLADKVDIIGSHGGYSLGNEFIEDVFYYNPSTTMGRTLEMAKAAGKEFWIDEYNTHLNSISSETVEYNREVNQSAVKGIAIAATLNGVLNMGADNVFLWQLADNQWPNVSNNNEFDNGLQIGGYLRSPLESMTPYAGYYAVSLLSRYIGQGTVYGCDDGFGIYLSCINRTDGEWTVVVTNYNIEDADVHINFQQSLGGKTFYRHLYDMSAVEPTPAAELIGISAKASSVTTGFYDTLPAYSVAVYTTVAD